MQLSTLFVALSLALAASARPRHYGRASFSSENAREAVLLNQQFSRLDANSACKEGQNACVGTAFAQCAGGKFVLTPCPEGLICTALPDVNSRGTTVTCTTEADANARLGGALGAPGAPSDDPTPPPAATSVAATTSVAASAPPATSIDVGTSVVTSAGATASASASVAAPPASSAAVSGTSVVASASAVDTAAATASASVAAPPASSAAVSDTAVAASTVVSSAAATGTVAAGNNAGTGAAAGDDPQTSKTLLDSVIAPGFAQDGQAVKDANQVPSATSTNNFINFCATVKKPITNGQQITGGSCNPAPMGVIASTANMPSSKFISPKNLDKIPANTNFTIKMAIRNLATGFFTNPNSTYFAAPQEVDAATGNIKGHSHITIDAVASLTDTTPTDPTQFKWFKGLNTPAQGGVLTATVAGLPAGTYRLASINSAANHQPALVAVAQHGALDDMVYFTVE